MPAHTGGGTCVLANADGLSIVLGGQDWVVKIWNQNGILGMNLASVGGAVTSCDSNNRGKYLMFMCGMMVTVRSASFKQD
jgi:hypothetical protein